MAEVLPQKPKRVLSAYNFFFQDQRSKIISGEADDCSVEGDQAAQDGAGPRKVSFQSLGKSVGRRWRRLAPEDRIEFEIAGAADKKRYTREMADYKEECKILKRKQAQTQQETTEKKPKLGETTQTNYNPDQAPVPKVIPRSAEHRNETIFCQIASSFTNSTEHPSVYSRDGFGNTGHYSRQFSFSSAQRNDNYDFWYGQTAAGNHHGGGPYSSGMHIPAAPPLSAAGNHHGGGPYSSGMPYHSAAPPPSAAGNHHGGGPYSSGMPYHPAAPPPSAAGNHHGGGPYSSGMPYHSAAPPPCSSHPARYHDPGYVASHSEDIAHSYPNAEVARVAESHHGGWNCSTGMLHYSEASSLYSSHPTRYDSGYTASQPGNIAHSHPNNEVARQGNLSISPYNQFPPMHGNTFPYQQQTMYPSYSNAPPKVPLYENHSSQQQAHWTTSSYPHSKQSIYMPTT